MIKGLTVNRINQLWVADITYIDTDEGVAYLHLLTDALHVHEIIGWVLSDSLVASNTVTAGDGYLARVTLGFDGLIHHLTAAFNIVVSYIDRLQANKATIRMTEDYKPTDNAIAERGQRWNRQEWHPG